MVEYTTKPHPDWIPPIEMLRRDVERMIGEPPGHCRDVMAGMAGPLIGGGVGLSGFHFDPVTRNAVFWIDRPGPWEGMSGRVEVRSEGYQ